MKSIKRKNYKRKRKKRTRKGYNKGGVHADPLHFAELEHAITGHHPIFPNAVGHNNTFLTEFMKSVRRTLGFEKTMDEFQREIARLPAKTERRKSPPKRKRKTKRKSPTPTIAEIIEASVLG